MKGFFNFLQARRDDERNALWGASEDVELERGWPTGKRWAVLLRKEMYDHGSVLRVFGRKS